MTVVNPAFSQRKEAKLTDYITLHCDQADDCLNKKCEHLSTKGLLKKVDKKDIAFAEPRHCSKFRQEGNTAVGAEINEVGVSK